MADCIKDFTKTKIEELLLGFGFEPVIVGLKIDVNHKELGCYKRNELYCMITFTRHPNIHGKFKEWVFIEYADSLYDAERQVFEDGDTIPLDVPIEQIIFEIEIELQRAINRTLA